MQAGLSAEPKENERNGSLVSRVKWENGTWVSSLKVDPERKSQPGAFD